MATKTQQQSTQTKGVAYTTEAEFMVRSEILGGQIRTEKIRGLKADLKAETAVADSASADLSVRKEVRADRMLTQLAIEEEKLGIDRDNLSATQAYRQLNQAGHAAALTSKAYKINATEAVNQGRKQFLLNAGIQAVPVTIEATAKKVVK
jgi:hypothetical protein